MRYFGLSPDEYAMAIQGDDNFLIVTKNAFQLKIKSVQLLESYAQNLGFKFDCDDIRSPNYDGISLL